MKGKKVDLGCMNCGIARALEVVGDRWTLLIVRDAFHGRQRFGEFQKSLGVAKNILAVRLKKLVDVGVFDIQADADSAISHLYVLTRKGEQLCVVLVALWQWGAEHCFSPGELKFDMVDSRGEKPLADLRLKAQDGRTLRPREFRMAPRRGADRRATRH